MHDFRALLRPPNPDGCWSTCEKDMEQTVRCSPVHLGGFSRVPAGLQKRSSTERIRYNLVSPCRVANQPINLPILTMWLLQGRRWQRVRRTFRFSGDALLRRTLLYFRKRGKLVSHDAKFRWDIRGPPDGLGKI